MVFHKSLNELLENYTHTKGPIPSLNMPIKGIKECVHWSLPPEGCLKENFDGVTKSNLGKARASGIIKNSSGKGIEAFTTPLRIQTSHYVEAIVAH